MRPEDVVIGRRVTYAQNPTITDFYVSSEVRGVSGKIDEGIQNVSGSTAYSFDYLVSVSFDNGIQQDIPLDDLTLEFEQPSEQNQSIPDEWHDYASNSDVALNDRVKYKKSYSNIPSDSLGTVIDISEVGTSGLVLVSFDDKSVGLNGIWSCSVGNLKTSEKRVQNSCPSLIKGRRFKLIKDGFSGVSLHRIGTTGRFISERTPTGRAKAKFDDGDSILFVHTNDVIWI